MILKRLQVRTPQPNLLTNCYIVCDEKSKETIVVDPGGEPEKPGGETTEVDNLNSSNNYDGAIKFFRNGQLFIQRGDMLFNAQGARVK